IVQALQDAPITVYGDGAQTRSFCYVTDLVEAVVRLMASPDDFTGPVNLGNPEERAIIELAEIVIELTGSRSQIVRAKLPADDPSRRCPDIGLACEALDWTPRVPLREGLERTIAYFEERLSGRSGAARHRSDALVRISN